MTEIHAIVRRQRATATRDELRRAGCEGYTLFPALGRGRQRGVRSAGSQAIGCGFLPRLVFYLVVEDDEALPIVEALIRANQTGEFGDGRVFLSKLDTAGRVSEGVARIEEKALR